MFNIFKRKGKSKMPTKEDLEKMTLEEKKELLNKLTEDIKLSEDDTNPDNATKENEQEDQHEEVEQENQLEGGKADNMSLEDIAKKHNVTVEVIESELEKGIKVEMEHTDDPEKAKEIALDHLSEQSDYYEKLKQVETQPQQPNLEEKFAEIENRIEEKMQSLIDTLSKQLDQRDATIKGLNEQIEEIKRTSPTQIVKPIITQQSLETPHETEKKRVINTWTNSPSTQIAREK